MPVGPLVSVILPTKDRPERLADALASVLSQTYSNLEVIVVDDGSDQAVAAANDALVGGHRQARYLRHEAPLGPAAARNAGLAAARGEYVAFCDDDDQWFPNAAAVTVEFLADHPGVHGVSGWHEVVHASSGRVATYRGPLRYDAGSLLWFNFVALPFAVLRRNAFHSDPRFDEALPAHEDWDLWLRCAEEHPFRTAPAVLYRYVQHRSSRVTRSGRLPRATRAFLSKHGERMTDPCRAYHEACIRLLERAPERSHLGDAMDLLRQTPPGTAALLASQRVAAAVGQRRGDPALPARVLLRGIEARRSVRARDRARDNAPGRRSA